MNRGYEQLDQDVQFRGPDGGVLGSDQPGFAQWVETTTERSLLHMERSGARTVVALEPIPYGSINQLACLAEAELVESCREVVDVRPTRVETVLRDLGARHDDLVVLDIDHLVCPYLPVCDPIVDGSVVRTDWTHLTATFAASLAPAIRESFVSNGMIG